MLMESSSEGKKERARMRTRTPLRTPAQCSIKPVSKFGFHLIINLKRLAFVSKQDVLVDATLQYILFFDAIEVLSNLNFFSINLLKIQENLLKIVLYWGINTI